MTEKTKAELIRQQVDSFPILSATVFRIMRVTADPKSSADDLMQALLSRTSPFASLFSSWLIPSSSAVLKGLIR